MEDLPWSNTDLPEDLRTALLSQKGLDPDSVANLGQSRATRILTRAMIVTTMVVVLAASGELFYFGLVHTECTLSKPLGSTILNTPLAIANSPFNGSAWINLSDAGPSYSFTSGGLTIVTDPMNGSPLSNWNTGGHGSLPFGFAMAVNWTVYSVTNVSEFSLHPGACTAPYVAMAGSAQTQGVLGDFIQTFQLNLSNPHSDVGEPSSFPGVPSVHFDNGLDPGLWNASARTSGGATYLPYIDTYSDCILGPHTLFNPAPPFRIPIEVTVPFGAGVATANGFLNWTGGAGFNSPVTYQLPPEGGNWTFESVGAPFEIAPAASFPPAGLLAFSYDGPCLPP